MSIVRCRYCEGPADAIASVDEYVGTCRGEVRVENGSLEFEPAGYTEIAWDSCEQIGWQCRSCFAEEIAEEKPATRLDLDATLWRLVEIVRDEEAKS